MSNEAYDIEDGSLNPATNPPALRVLKPGVVNPSGKVSAASTLVVKSISIKQEQAIRLYAVGQIGSVQEAAALAGVGPARFGLILNSPLGQKIVDSIRGELDFKYQALYKKFIGVVSDAMDHPEPAVALAGASLFAKTQIGTKHKVELSAEDIVQQIISGSYQRD